MARVGPPAKAFHAEWKEANEYTSCSTPARHPCPQLPLNQAVRPMIPGASGGFSTAARRLSTTSRSCRARSRNACASVSTTSRSRRRACSTPAAARAKTFPACASAFPKRRCSAPTCRTACSRARCTTIPATPSWRRFLPASLGKALGARGPRFAQADFSALPFAAGAFEFIWSNLALHWHSRPDLVFPEWQRVLKVNGLLMFSTLGPDYAQGIARRLRRGRGRARRRVAQACDRLRRHARSRRYAGGKRLRDSRDGPGSRSPSPTSRRESLLADVRRWGAYPFEREASSGAAARRLHKALLAALEARRRADGTIALTFEVIYGHAWKAVPRTTAEGHGIVRLEDIGRGSSRNR